jgi:hypothetical protein
VVAALELPVSTSRLCPYTHVAVSVGENLYPDHYVAVAASSGLMHGVTPTLFAPEAEITRAQALSVLARALDLVRPGLLPPAADPVSASADVDRAATAGLQGGLQAAKQASALDSPATRQEVETMVKRCLELAGVVG